MVLSFTYDPINNKAAAFVLTIHNASVYTMYPVIVLGLNHNGAILYPLETDYGPNETETIGKLLMLIHELYVNNKDLFMRVTPSKPKTFLLILNKIFVILKYIQMNPLKPYSYILEKDVFV